MTMTLMMLMMMTMMMVVMLREVVVATGMIDLFSEYFEAISSSV